jgi:hypothetical protein
MSAVSPTSLVTLFHDDTMESIDAKQLMDTSNISYTGIFSKKEANWAMPFIFTDANAYRIKGLKEISAFAVDEIRKNTDVFYETRVQYQSSYISNASEMWLLESLCGEERVIAAILHSKQAIITDKLIIEIMTDCGIVYFTDANNKILASINTPLIRSFYGTLQEKSAAECLNQFTLQQLEEAKEKQYVKLL